MTDEQDPLAPLLRAVEAYSKRPWRGEALEVRRVAALYGAWQRLTLGRTPAARIAAEAARRAYEESGEPQDRKG